VWQTVNQNSSLSRRSTELLHVLHNLRANAALPAAFCFERVGCEHAVNSSTRELVDAEHEFLSSSGDREQFVLILRNSFRNSRNSSKGKQGLTEEIPLLDAKLENHCCATRAFSVLPNFSFDAAHPFHIRARWSVPSGCVV
jgi:hypothetical protein